MGILKFSSRLPLGEGLGKRDHSGVGEPKALSPTLSQREREKKIRAQLARRR
jgi:hypothetical protein